MQTDRRRAWLVRRSHAALMLLAPLGCTVQPGNTAPATAPISSERPVFDASVPSPEEPERPGPTVAILQADAPTRFHAEIDPLRDRLRACQLDAGTSLQVRIRRLGAVMHIDFGPGAQLGDGPRRCVHAALVAVDRDGQLSRGSPAERVSGFTALLQLEW